MIRKWSFFFFFFPFLVSNDLGFDNFLQLNKKYIQSFFFFAKNFRSKDKDKDKTTNDRG